MDHRMVRIYFGTVNLPVKRCRGINEYLMPPFYEEGYPLTGVNAVQIAEKEDPQLFYLAL